MKRVLYYTTLKIGTILLLAFTVLTSAFNGVALMIAKPWLGFLYSLDAKLTDIEIASIQPIKKKRKRAKR